MNLRQLEHLVALADEGSFARAAEKVNLSQPALTRSMQSLEEEMALQLLDRHPRGVTLTPGGKVVVERARRVLFETRALDRDVSLFKDHDLGDASFGMGPYPAAVMLPEVLATLTKSYPRLSIRTDVDNWTVLLNRLQSEAIDFFVVERRAVPPLPELSSRLMSRHRCAWFARPRHPVFKNKNPEHALLRQMKLASVPLPAHMREEMRKSLRFKPAEMLNFQVECNSVFALKQLAEQSDTVIYGPVSSVRREVEQGSLRQIVFGDSSGFSMQFAIVHLAHRTVSPTVQRIMEAVIGCDRAVNAS